jgi:hypothetical protein
VSQEKGGRQRHIATILAGLFLLHKDWIIVKTLSA